ncbi:hypothetical protein GLA29479_4504 [Lysobacter antibioticus]|nr:hypothetical protein GLA29479_4504 [Lysobacter antibioticus]
MTRSDVASAATDLGSDTARASARPAPAATPSSKRGRSSILIARRYRRSPPHASTTD